jgi:hypothetical protein
MFPCSSHHLEAAIFNGVVWNQIYFCFYRAPYDTMKAHPQGLRFLLLTTVKKRKIDGNVLQATVFQQPVASGRQHSDRWFCFVFFSLSGCDAVSSRVLSVFGGSTRTTHCCRKLSASY